MFVKLRQFQEFIKKKKIDAAILTNYLEKRNSNFTYFTQTDKVNGMLVLKEKPVLYTSPLEYEIAKKHSAIKNIKVLDENIFKELKDFNKIGIDESFATLNQFKELKSRLKRPRFIDISKKISDLRIIKTEEEISYIKKSCRFADLVVQNAMNYTEKARTEAELKMFIEKNIIVLGLEKSFEPIVASSGNSKNPHHISDKTKLRGFVVIDVGVKYKNYCSDITRTIFKGKPNKKEIKIYDKVLNVQQGCINDDKKPFELQKKTQKVLGRYFIHSLGHGIGLDVHELPLVSLSEKKRFKENMVFTIEPGYYNKFGIRIEDVVLYKNNKKVVLTKTPKGLITK